MTRILNGLTNFVIKLQVVAVIIPQFLKMIRKIMKKIRARIGTRIGTPKWYQSHISCLFHRQNPWKYILEQAQLANEQWYVEQELASPARDSLSGISDG